MFGMLQQELYYFHKDYSHLIDAEIAASIKKKSLKPADTAHGSGKTQSQKPSSTQNSK